MSLLLQTRSCLRYIPHNGSQVRGSGTEGKFVNTIDEPFDPLLGKKAELRQGSDGRWAEFTGGIYGTSKKVKRLIGLFTFSVFYLLVDISAVSTKHPSITLILIGA
jgi:hypothetical protein